MLFYKNVSFCFCISQKWQFWIKRTFAQNFFVVLFFMGPREPALKMGIINIFKYVTPLWNDNFKQIEKTPETGSANVQRDIDR